MTLFMLKFACSFVDEFDLELDLSCACLCIILVVLVCAKVLVNGLKKHV